MKHHNHHQWRGNLRTAVSALSAGIFAVVASSALAQPSAVGQWSSVQNWTNVAVHAHMLSSGKVLFYPYSDVVRLWDPATAAITAAPQAGYNIFCTGHSHIGDGRLLVTGGHVQNGWGLNDASYYNPANNTWTRLADMNNGRWYPSSTTLANGDVLITSGSYDTNYANNTLPQVWQVPSSSWRNLTNALRSLALYPRTFLAPNGRVFFATSTSRYLDTAGSGAWTTLANTIHSGRDNYGSAALYDVGKVLWAGGGDPPTATCEKTDLHAATQAWSSSGSMANARRQNNLTILPDGKVLVTGGSSMAGFNNTTGAVLVAEMWNPATGTWSTMAGYTRYRGYHSTALLLPDGRVLSSGGDGQPNAEVYSPPYMFNGTRPTISSAPADISHGTTFFVGTTDTVSKITLTRLGSATHAQNWDQRINFLTFKPATGGYNVVAPVRTEDCPPGYYYLWILNSAGLPSVSKLVRISSPGATAYQQINDANGFVSMEVENYTARVVQGGRAWVDAPNTGFAGTRAFQAMPNSGGLNDTNYVANSPRLDFRVKFTKTGTHYVWVRGIGANGNDDSCHVGLNNTANTTADRIAVTSTSFGWTKATMDGPVATINVHSVGIHTVNLWMREDGTVVDKLLLTTSSTYTPTGNGPDETTRLSNEIIVDNTDVTGVSISGAWTASTSMAGYYGINYIHDGNTAGGKSVRYSPVVPATGSYQVYLRWTTGTNRATNVPVDVNHTGGTTTLSINQQNNNGTWVSLGTYNFSAGTTGNVLVRNDGANGYVIADAVRFVLP
ncbi:MAG: galactose oxidase-like domain-containing protein [Verrucomicrobiota bacterium]